MNILDFFCEEKICDKDFNELKQNYFTELKQSFNSCTECDMFSVQKKYLNLLYYAMKNNNHKDK